MTRVVPAVFLVDVDDTLPENDRIQDLAASQRNRVERPNNIPLLSMSRFLLDYPFANRLYRGALDALERFRAWGPTTGILSDGDIVFRPRKVARLGFSEATGGPCAFLHP